MTDKQWSLTRVALAVPLGFGISTAVSHMHHMHQWQHIVVAVCLVTLTIEILDHIRERKQQRHERP